MSINIQTLISFPISSAYDPPLSVLPSADTRGRFKTPRVPAHSITHVLGLPKEFKILHCLCLRAERCHKPIKPVISGVVRGFLRCRNNSDFFSPAGRTKIPKCKTTQYPNKWKPLLFYSCFICILSQLTNNHRHQPSDETSKVALLKTFHGKYTT